MAATGTRADAAPDMAGFELVVGGMTCAACAARVQAKLNKVTGVTASVNLSTERAYVTAPVQISARDLVDVVEAAGYTAELAAPREQDAGADATAAADEAAVRRLRRRLALALVFFVPLTDLSLMLSVFGWTRFPGWQWLLLALAAPVAIWAAWPFHAAALRQARHLSSSMDTLVSLGIVAACGWSVYAMFVLDRGRAGLSGLASLLHGSGGGIYLEVAAAMARQVQAAGLDGQIALLEITVDPQRDTPARLAAYQKMFGSPQPAWTLATATTAAATAALWKFFHVYYHRQPADDPDATDWLTGQQLTYDVEHSNTLIFLSADGKQRYIVDAAADTGDNRPPPALIRFMTPQGRHNLYHPSPGGSWTVPQAMQVLSWLAGRTIATRSP